MNDSYPVRMTAAEIRELRAMYRWYRRMVYGGSGENGVELREETSRGTFIAVVNAPGIVAAVDINTPTTGTVTLKKLWFPGTDYTTTDRKIVDATESSVYEEGAASEVAYNLDAIDYSEGDVVLVSELEHGGFVILGANTNPVVPTGTCGCSCIEDGDIVVDTYVTTSQWTVSLSELSVQETYGQVVLPANDHLLEWNSGGGYWEKDIGDELLGYDNAGDPVTFGSTPSPAYIRFDNNDSGYMTMKIVWPDDLIPAP